MARVLFVTLPNRFGMRAFVLSPNQYGEYISRLGSAENYHTELTDACMTAIADTHGLKCIPTEVLCSIE